MTTETELEEAGRPLLEPLEEAWTSWHLDFTEVCYEPRGASFRQP